MENELNEIRQQQEKNKQLTTITSDNILTLLEQRKTAVLEGFEDGFKLALFIKLFEEKLKKIKTEIQETAVSETIEKIEWSGYRFENTQSGRYNYSNFGKWNDLNDAKKQLETDMKAASKSKNTIVDKEGEIIEPAIYKANKTSIKITKIK